MPKIIPSIDNAATRGARAAAMRTHRSMFQSLVLREPTPEQGRYLRQVEEASFNYDRQHPFRLVLLRRDEADGVTRKPPSSVALKVKKWSDHNG